MRPPCTWQVCALLNKDPAQRMTIEQLLQHPWIVSGGVSKGGEREIALQDAKRTEFRRLTAKLRAACFAVMLQQQAAERGAEREAAAKPAVPVDEKEAKLARVSVRWQGGHAEVSPSSGGRRVTAIRYRHRCATRCVGTTRQSAV